MAGHEWNEIGRVAAPEALPVDGGGITIKEGHLTVWKLYDGTMDTAIYAIGRSLETAIRAHESNWKMAHALMKTDREICDEHSMKLNEIDAVRIRR